MILGATAQFVGWLTVLLLAVIMSMSYSALETGIYVMNKIRLDLMAEAGSRTALTLRRLISNNRNLLSVLLIGNNIGNYFATFAISSLMLLAGLTAAQAQWWTLLAATPLLFILGEGVPKNVAQRRADTLPYQLTWWLRVSSIVYNATGVALVVRGFSWLLMRLAHRTGARAPLGHEGFTAIVAEGRASGVLTHFQSVMADRIMHMPEVKLADIMIPMADAATVSAGDDKDDLLETLRQTNFSRLPVLDARGQVVGILDTYDILLDSDGQPLAELLYQPLLLAGSMPASDALYQMRRARQVMAVISDAEGRHVGIVTVKDIVEEIVGELEAW